VTQADRAVERWRGRSGGERAAWTSGEEMGRGCEVRERCGRARMIIDPIDGTEEFSRGFRRSAR